MTKMKIAVVFTGLMRSFERAYQNQRRFLFTLPAEYDLFFHTWSELGYYTGKGYLPEENGFVRIKEDDRGFHPGGPPVTEDLIRQTYTHYNIRSIVIEEFDTMQPEFDRRKLNFPNAFTRPKNTIAQFYKIMKGMDEFANYCSTTNMEYDMVIRLRPDLVPQGPVWVRPYNPNVMLVFPGGNKLGQGTGDSINISNPNTIYQFSRAYQYLEEMYKLTNISCPHLYVPIMAQSINVPLEFIHAPAEIAHSPHAPYHEPEGGIYVPK